MSNDIRIRQLTRRVHSLEGQLSGLREVSGICVSGAELIVPLLSVDYGIDGRFTLRFSTLPDELYQIQVSSDMITWEVAPGAGAVPAHATQAYTDWLSESYGLDELPRYFRVRRHPRAAMACVPSIPVCQ